MYTCYKRFSLFPENQCYGYSGHQHTVTRNVVSDNQYRLDSTSLVRRNKLAHVLAKSSGKQIVTNINIALKRPRSERRVVSDKVCQL